MSLNSVTRGKGPKDEVHFSLSRGGRNDEEKQQRRATLAVRGAGTLSGSQEQTSVQRREGFEGKGERD